MIEFNSLKILDNSFITETDSFDVFIIPGAYGSTISPKGEITHNSKAAFALLRISPKGEFGKRGSYMFNNIEDSIHFIKEYLDKCNTISEVDIAYNSFCVGQDNINKGFKS